MITFEMTEEEARVLVEVLQADLSDLRMEIASTDRLAFREMLRTKKWVVKDVVARLRGELRPTAAASLPRELHPVP